MELITAQDFTHSSLVTAMKLPLAPAGDSALQELCWLVEKQDFLSTENQQEQEL